MTKTPKISIGNRGIAADQPCYIIAEIGVNHNGDVDLAHKMIDAAKVAGADAVKFQTFKAEHLVSIDAPKAEYQADKTGSGNQFSMLKALELPIPAYSDLRDHCGESNIDFMSTAFEEESLDVVLALDPVCIKWPSGELNNWPLLRRAAKARKPMLLSTGMGSITEIAAAIDLLAAEDCHDVAILQCVSNYPAPIEEQNLRVIPNMSSMFGKPTGFSDHTEGPFAAIAARALGMAVLEKHFTLDRGMVGPDHAASIEPDGFAEMVEILRKIELGLGDGVKRVMPSEVGVKKVARKSLMFAGDLPEGHILSADDLIAKRPEGGLPPDKLEFFIGRRLSRGVRMDEMLTLDQIG